MVLAMGIGWLTAGCTRPAVVAVKEAMQEPASNVSLKGEAVRLQLTSPNVVLIDPLALDGLRDKLQALEGRSVTERRQLLASLSVPLRIAVREVKDFRPGFYRVSPYDFEDARGSGAHPDVVDVDSGSMVIADLDHLARVAKVLTWARLDLALRGPVGDRTEFRKIEKELGGPFFAFLTSSSDSPFVGDGSYRLRAGAPVSIE